MSVRISVRLSVHLLVGSLIHPLRLSERLTVCPFGPFVYLSICLSALLIVCPSLCLSIFLYTCWIETDRQTGRVSMDETVTDFMGQCYKTFYGRKLRNKQECLSLASFSNLV